MQMVMIRYTYREPKDTIMVTLVRHFQTSIETCSKCLIRAVGKYVVTRDNMLKPYQKSLRMMHFCLRL